MTPPEPERVRHPVAAACSGALGAILALVPQLAARWAFLVVTVVVAVVVAVSLARRRTAWRPLAFAGGWVAVPVVIVLTFPGALPELTEWMHSHRFDAATWRGARGAPYEDRTRLRMLDDLRRSGALDGRTRDEVLSLLGEPDRTEAGPGPALWWRAGPDGVIDSISLRVWFGPDGRVVRHDLACD
ncbi:MAG: hypothetical protein U1E39_06195 [Planctomycetota bacterium]